MDRQAVSVCVCLMSNADTNGEKDRIVFPISYLMSWTLFLSLSLVPICLRILN